MQNAWAILAIKVSMAAFPLGKNSKPKGQRSRPPESPPSTFLNKQTRAAISGYLDLPLEEHTLKGIESRCKVVEKGNTVGNR